MITHKTANRVSLLFGTDDTTGGKPDPTYTLALTTYTDNGYPLCWAFDSVEQYTLACWHLNRHCVEWEAHHFIDRHNKPHPVGPELDWEELSDGLNDADEVERWIYMSRLNKPNAKPMNPDYDLERNDQ